ncbi:hypothetical protein ONZ45_g11268 [Pleurotus djamor]|nr:hypothetical protein ONZ45_g11268 [Pleurotus djamor]
MEYHHTGYLPGGNLLLSIDEDDITTFTHGLPIRLFSKLVSRAWVANLITHKWKAPREVREMEGDFRYVILSHRWLKMEIDNTDLMEYVQGRVSEGKEESKRKLDGFLSAVRAAGYRLVWFDTGCIDQRNGPEVDESIRSMFTWYRNADVCFVYLRDTSQLNEIHKDGWFKRGWTLQELLAPRKIIFFNKDWCRILPNVQVADIIHPAFTPTYPRQTEWSDQALRKEVVDGAGIDGNDSFSLLDCFFLPHPIRAPQIFGCMSKRRTTRPEDMAYCLISLLNVQIPIAYGEGGERAFYRLQLACIQESKSRSILSWDYANGSASHWNTMLAADPSSFPTNDNPPLIYFNIFSPSSRAQVDESFTINNAGMRIMICLFHLRSPVIAKTISVSGSSCELQLLADKAQGLQLDTRLVLRSSNDNLPANFGVLLKYNVIGVYGWSGSTSYGVLLRNQYPSFTYTRDIELSIDRLPSKEAFLNSGVLRPQWVYIE